jgi:hypothetical protein
MLSLRTSAKIATAVILLGGAFTNAVAETSAVDRQDQLRAAYLFNFLKFVEWPSSVPPGSLTVCVTGDEGLSDALDRSMRNKRIGQRSLSVRRVQQAEIDTNCHVSFISGEAFSEKLLPVPAAQPTLTVSDIDGFARRGGMIELFTENNRLRFSVNVDSARKAGLSISSNLLQLAASVTGGSR